MKKHVQKKFCKHNRVNGFTLIEMAIVLVIIGLIVAGVLVGSDMINAAAVRMQIAQIEKYQSAVNTFKTKYNNQLPGDIDNADAVAFGFAARGSYAGEGDGNGVIEIISHNASGDNWGGGSAVSGEGAVFWMDLSQANLIDGSFNSALTSSTIATSVTGGAVSTYLPPAKLGGGAYVYVWSGGINGGDSQNYFGIAGINDANGVPINYQFGGAHRFVVSAITVLQAYNIDNKIDDGSPLSGRVQVMEWAYNGVAYAEGGAGGNQASPTNAVWPGATDCWDNGGVANAATHYSLVAASAANANCALSFKF